MNFCLVKAQLYKSMDLNKSLTEADYKSTSWNIIRFEPAGFIIDNNVYVGGTQQSMLQVISAWQCLKGMLRFWRYCLRNLRHYIYHQRT
jgi:hypothetical protein